LAVIVAAHVALGLIYMWATPMFEASDEGGHYAFVRWLAQGRPLPIQRPDRPKSETTWEQEGSQPPLYYWLAAGLTAWINTDDFERAFVRNPLTRVGIPGTSHNVNLFRHSPGQSPFVGTALAVTISRLFSLALSAATVLLSFHVARRVFPKSDDSLALLTAALVAFNPMALFINASVNNDNLLMLLSTASLLLILELAHPETPRRWPKLAGLGLLLGLTALTKVSGLVLWPVAVLGLAWAEYRRVGIRPWPLLLHVGVALGIALALSGWWFWRNWQLYGEWLGTRTMVLVAGPRAVTPALWELVTQEWAGFYLSYWGIFGVFTLRLSDWAIAFFNLLSLWALAGLGWGLWRRRWRWTMAVSVCAVFILVTLVGVINWTLQTMASQGRLMFGAIAPLSTLMAAGVLGPLPGRWARRAGFGVIGALVVVAALVPLVDIAPRYTPPPLISETNLPADLHPVHAVMAEGMELIGYTSDATPIRPGDEQRVTLYWRALQPMGQDYVLALALVGRGLEPLGTVDTWPGGGLAPTSQWRPGMIFADAYQLPVNAEAQTPSRVRLSLSAWVDDLENRLPIRAPGGAVTRAIYLDVGRVIAAEAPPFTPGHPDGSTFENGITLLGWDANADGALALTLYWRGDQSIPADYTVFIHVVTTDGLQVASADSPPLDGDWPTSAWTPGQAFAETRLIALPSELPPNCCSVRLGFYTPDDGVRLAAFRADGAPWLENAVVLQDVVTSR
jgi:4-amino-4-deoxy-L-arabinose transferase-like glycosyltransferase